MRKTTKIFCLFILSSLGLFAQTNVTFKVDMNQSTMPVGSIPEVNGNFNGWCGSCAPMTDANSDGIWEKTISLAAGSYEYKFSYNNWAGQEMLIPGSACTITTGQYTNRTLTVASTAIVLPIVCYGSCSACGVTPPPPTQAQVTFKVDVSQSGLPVGAIPEVNGTFNGWCGSCNAMTDANADGIWETTILLNSGSYEYKFSYSNWTGQESLIPGTSCTITTGVNTNRALTVGSTAIVLPSVCYGLCTACSTGPTLTQMNLPVTFEGTAVDYGVIGFDGAEASTIVTDPTNPANTVVKVIKSASALPSAGTIITAAAALGLASPVPFSASNTSMSLKVWSPDAGIQVRLKVENHSDVNQSVETEATTTVANGWQTLVFNFANQAPGTAALNLAYSLDKASVFMNFAVAGSVSGEKIYYFDDLMMFVPTPPSASVLTGNTSICNGSTTNLNIEVTGGSSPYTVTVTDGTNNFTATGTSPVSIPVSPTATSTYSIVSVVGSGVMGMGNSGAATVTVTPNTINTTSETACDSYTWNGQTYTSSGSFTGETTNCITDILNLTITPNSSNITVATSCESYTWNNTTYTISGTYTGTTANCITEILDLTISPNLPNTTYETACDSYTWNGQTLFTSGIYTGETTNCGTELLNLTITPSTTDMTTITAPGSYTWAENSQTYYTSGIYSGSTANCITQVLNLTITVILAQMNLPVTFEGNTVDYGVIGFEGAEASTIVTDPTNPANTVVKVIKSASAQPWAGTTITAAAALGLASPVPFSATNTSMSLKVWSPDAGIQVRLKVENHSNPTQSVETEATTTVANGWQTLVFNFANQAPGTAALNLAYSLDKASVFMNFSVPGSNVGEKIYYFDDLMMYVPSTGPTSSILSGSSAICSGDSTNLSVQIVGGSSPYTVVITDGTNNYTSSGTSPVLFTVSPSLTTTTYSIVSVSGGGVGTGNSGTATVSVTPNSINSLTISASGSYTWTNNSQTYTSSGTYTGTTSNCVTEQLILTITGAGLEDLSDMGISVQPNPSNGLFSIMNSEQVNLTASITDCSGRVIYSADFTALENTIDISNVARGIYYLKLSSLNYSKVVQIFKN